MAPIISSNWAILLFFITLLLIVLFTDLSIKSIFTVLIVLGVGYGLYTMVTDSTSMLIVGLVGIIGVLLFAMASGYGRSQQTIVVNQKCETKPDNGLDWIYNAKNKTGCSVSSLKPPGVCPTGYYNYTDGEGNTLCCGSKNIDPYAHTCPALGPQGVCSMAPGTENTRVPGVKSYYPLCQDITNKQDNEISRKICPPQYPYFLKMSSPDKSFKCCGSKPASGTSCPSDTSCDSLKTGEDIFTAPNSCEALKFLSGLVCNDSSKPIITRLRDHNNINSKMKSVPVCLKSGGYPREVLEKCKSLGFCSDIKNIDKFRYNDDVITQIEKAKISNDKYFEYINNNNIQDEYPDFFK